MKVLAWVLAQPWCNGRIGTGGISYDGMAAFRLASGDTTGSVKAAALMFSPVDPFSELLAPGGILVGTRVLVGSLFVGLVGWLVLIFVCSLATVLEYVPEK